jgi:hypothetical protein
MRRARGRFDDQAGRTDTPTGIALETLTALGVRQSLQRGERAEDIVTR